MIKHYLPDKCTIIKEGDILGVYTKNNIVNGLVLKIKGEKEIGE